jgi:lipopolysaccharide transport system ATP-binding protein
LSTTELSAAVHAVGLGKRYDLGVQRRRDTLYDQAAAMFGRRAAPPAEEHPTIWALRDVSFDVLPGHVMAVIGRNGSGKTTLLKILARVTAPTEGSAELRGRVAALLQLGAGFHPELTGRDNILLSGAVLGMSRREIAEVHQQIVEFAEIGRFLDTAVKHYSSGMYVRLAFSVTAHLAAEIMLVDEVLAVGDAAFQEKCRARIRDMVRSGRAVIFVSHTMDAVRDLCDHALVLESGHVQFRGPTEEAIEFYEQEVLRLPAAQRSAPASALITK